VEKKGEDVSVLTAAKEGVEAGEDGEVGLAAGVECVDGDVGGGDLDGDVPRGGKGGDFDVVAALVEADGEFTDDGGGATAAEVGGEEEEFGVLGGQEGGI
jgi:hypothetical protein